MRTSMLAQKFYWLSRTSYQSSSVPCLGLLPPALFTGCTGLLSFSSTAPANAVVPREVLDELHALESSLKKSSLLDGRRRHTLSGKELKVRLPEVTIEPGLPVINAHLRPQTGTNFCKWLRQAGRVPGRILSLPRNASLNIHFKAQDGGRLVREFGLNGCLARVVQLNLVDPEDESNVLGSVRVKPDAVMVRSNTGVLESINFLHCPPRRIVKVDVPIRLVNDDVAPGVKKGGWMFLERRVAHYKCLGSSIPPFIEVDVKHLELGGMVLYRDLPIPPGTKLVAQNFNLPVVRCTNDVTETVSL